jgi:polynucleotide 5'-kinase involved in rRNA processing
MRWRELYPEWQQVVDELVASRETVLVLGGIDSGKTTFCSLLLKLKHQAGMQVGFVDLDAGQTTVGPPAAFSSVVIRKPYELLQDLTPDSLAFLGDVSPVRHMARLRSAARGACWTTCCPCSPTALLSTPTATSAAGTGAPTN